MSSASTTAAAASTARACAPRPSATCGAHTMSNSAIGCDDSGSGCAGNAARWPRVTEYRLKVASGAWRDTYRQSGSRDPPSCKATRWPA
eukprot:5949204-Pleurochrysis_carterae.AAC.1